MNPSVTAQSLRGLWRRSEEQAVAVGPAGRGGAHRGHGGLGGLEPGQRRAASTSARACASRTAATGYAVGWNGTAGFVLRSDDGGGDVGSRRRSRAPFPLRGVYFVDERRGWAVGDNGVIRHTASGGV